MPMTTEKTRRLGRGLEALLAVAPSASAGEASGVRRIAITQIRPNPFQPRREFPPDELAELETSIRAAGLLQPITVRPSPTSRGFELIAGERRLRAATRLGWTEIPAIVRDADDQALLSLALIENLQRSDLNPVEEAEGYQRLVQEFSLTHQQVAEVVGKDRTTVTNSLRLLGLPAAVRRMLHEGHLTVGHARALLGLANERAIIDLAREVVARGLTVRNVEQVVREGPRKGQKAAIKAPAKRQDPQVRRIEDQLRRRLQTDVSLNLSGRDRGEIRISFYSNDDLERVMELILGQSAGEL